MTHEEIYYNNKKQKFKVIDQPSVEDERISAAYKMGLKDGNTDRPEEQTLSAKQIQFSYKNAIYPEDDVKEFIKNAHDDLKKVWCSGFIALSEECFEREWNKMLKERAGEKLK